MTGATHQAGAVLAAGLYAGAAGLSPALTALTAAGAFATASLPDRLDPRPTLDPTDQRRYDHRRWAHSLLPGAGAILLALITVLRFGYPAAGSGEDELIPVALSLLLEKDFGHAVSVVAVGAAVGYLSHLALDTLTAKGIWLTRPGGRRLGVPLVKHGRLPEPLVLGAITLALIPAVVLPLLPGVIPL